MKSTGYLRQFRFYVSRKYSKCCENVKNEYSGPIGLHAHNNLGLAFINSIAAVDAGATGLITLTGLEGQEIQNLKNFSYILKMMTNTMTAVNLLEEYFII